MKRYKEEGATRLENLPSSGNHDHEGREIAGGIVSQELHATGKSHPRQEAIC